MKRATSIIAVWGLVFYLGLFSGFALLHAYAQDELTDPHGCLIGSWVQHADATDAAAPPLVALVYVSQFLQSSSGAILPVFVLGHASRGPPLSAP